MGEKQIEKWLGDEVKKRGGLYYKFVSPGNAGVPDRIVVLNGKIYFVELKTTIGRMSARQCQQRRKLKAAGADVRLLFGMYDAERFLEEVLDA